MKRKITKVRNAVPPRLSELVKAVRMNLFSADQSLNPIELIASRRTARWLANYRTSIVHFHNLLRIQPRTITFSRF